MKTIGSLVRIFLTQDISSTGVILGTQTNNFTALNKLFLDNRYVSYWKFEVIYTFQSEVSSSALNFVINQPPENGSCSIDPLNGTTTTVFKINCSDWVDDDGIQDYSLHCKNKEYIP